MPTKATFLQLQSTTTPRRSFYCCLSVWCAALEYSPVAERFNRTDRHNHCFVWRDVQRGRDACRPSVRTSVCQSRQPVPPPPPPATIVTVIVFILCELIFVATLCLLFIFLVCEFYVNFLFYNFSYSFEVYLCSSYFVVPDQQIFPAETLHHVVSGLIVNVERIV